MVGYHDSDLTPFVWCDTCWKRKHPAKTKQAPMQMVKSGVPMQRIATDKLGELPETENGNKYILVVSDYFTKLKQPTFVLSPLI
jgi:hypothetical protein